ncbi:hypothetical protein FB565_003013 [Actinoplanes lutulentus]|uniref:Uncharacterized protein n=1 Tax=Actinoplanes lutulentus TaxID=1287878 RepID=A0A327Z4M1_9ACTN|nr:hypothetical protein [Actinoplanes lutulentus]MBB2943300.1 hypothetical protein [Actinoplanes lutulentus]RAK28359.1 hypothetical protein B0I29_120127 [Actinoplanes lutulentus]
MLDGDHAIAAAFLKTLGRLGDRGLSGSFIEREAYLADPVTGKRSFFDFKVSRNGQHLAVIETKVDSALTSEDQAQRRLDAAAGDGLLVFVTRDPLPAALAAEVQHQLGVPITERGGVWHGTAGGKAVLLVAWNRFLNDVADDDGKRFDELVALAAEVEEVTEFVPFTEMVRDAAVGRTTAQVVRIARRMCERLSGRLTNAGVSHKVSTIRDRGDQVYVG